MNKKAYIVLLTGILFNLSIGVIYVWSLLKVEMTTCISQGGWGWTSSQAGLPYTIAIICFALGVLIGGRVQDKIGPRWVATTGGALVGLGLIFSGLIGNSPTGIALCFGVITGLGIGFGYNSVLPAALKWFHPKQKGLISGLILGGFGLGALHYGPIKSSLLNNFGKEGALLYLGIAVSIISVFFAQFIKNPPVAYVPSDPSRKVLPGEAVKNTVKNNTGVDHTWKEMLKTKRFYLMFILFLLSSSMGLMVLGNIAKITNTQLVGFTNTALLISFMAVIYYTGVP